MAVKATEIKARRVRLVDAQTPIALAELGDSVDAYSVQPNQGGEYSLLALDKVLYSGTLPAGQQVLIADCPKYGRVVVMDGELQGAEIDQQLYHELLVHPALLMHPNPRRVLLVGGSEGGALPQILQHRSVESITMVGCNSALIDLAKQHLQSWHKDAFADPRIRIVDGCSREFLSGDPVKYDVVICDLPDLDLSSENRSTYTKQFFALLRSRLSAGGMMAVQGTQLAQARDEHFVLKRTIASVFSEVHSYHAMIPSFLSDWAFIIASDWFNPKKMTEKSFNDVAAMRLKANQLRYVDGEFLLSCFLFPKQLRARMSESGSCLED
jgi:spermidine synthase